MAHLFLALFLLIFGLNILIGLSIPMWVIGALALIAGVLLVPGARGSEIMEAGCPHPAIA